MSLLTEQQKAEYEKEFCDYNIANLDLDIPFATPRKILEWLEAQQVSVEPVVLQKTADGLLPCPFCGGEAGIGTTRISDKRTAELNKRTNGFFVNCKICGANNNCLHLGYATKEIAQHYWNTRKCSLDALVKPEIAEELYKECIDYAYTQVPEINTDEDMANYWRKAFFYLHIKFKHIRDAEQFSV